MSKAEIDDRHDPVWAAKSFERGRPAFTGGKPHDIQVRQAWLDYQSARMGSDPDTTARARVTWRVAFAAWLQDLMFEMAREDERHVSQAHRRMDKSGQIDPDDTLPSESRDRVEELVRVSRERERGESIRRETTRYGGPSDWRPM